MREMFSHIHAVNVLWVRISDYLTVPWVRISGYWSYDALWLEYTQEPIRIWEQAKIVMWLWSHFVTGDHFLLKAKKQSSWWGRKIRGSPKVVLKCRWTGQHGNAHSLPRLHALRRRFLYNLHIYMLLFRSCIRS